MNRNAFLYLSASVISLGTVISSCSKSSPAPANPGGGGAVDVCAGKTITITATPTGATPCTADGKVSVSATGSTGFTFKLNATGTYQSSADFNNVAPGSYTVFAKDAAGCEKSAAVTVGNAGTAGAKFTAVKALIAARCQSCHNAANPNGGNNYENECVIIAKKDRIKIRAVDEGTMPQSGPLSASDKAIITDWINAGGGYNN